jgi:hypothetical protein
MDNFVLYKKLYDIDKNGHKKAVKNMKPLFRYSKVTMDGNKKDEIIRVAQENLYMLKRINERSSVYNVDKWDRDYRISQYYKRNHCQYPSIDFNKTQKEGSRANMFVTSQKKRPKKNFSQTHFSRIIKNGKVKKKFEDFSYKDLKMIGKSKSEIGYNMKSAKFKKLFENAENIEKQKEEEKQIENNKEKNNNQKKNEGEKEYEIKDNNNMDNV